MPANPFSAARIDGLVDRVRATTRQQIIDLTLEKTAENQARIRAAFGHDAPITRYVDGSASKPLERVNEAGFTLTEFDFSEHVLDESIKALIVASPVGPDEGGHYRDDHWLFVNGQRQDAAFGDGPVRIGPKDDVVIVNVRPYARMIEGGAVERFRARLTNRRPGLSVQAPNGVYEITARALQRRFGNIANFYFTFRGMVGSAALPRSGPRAVKRNAHGRFVSTGGPSAGNKSDDRFPAIEIVMRPL